MELYEDESDGHVAAPTTSKRRKHSSLNEYALSGSARGPYKKRQLTPQASKRQKTREKEERTNRAKEAKEQRRVLFQTAKRGLEKLNEALTKKASWKKNCSVYEELDDCHVLSDAEHLNLYFRCGKVRSVLLIVIDEKSERVTGLVKACLAVMLYDIAYHWRTVLGWVNEFLQNDLRFKRMMTGTFSKTKAIIGEEDIRRRARIWVNKNRCPKGKAPMTIADFHEYLQNSLLVEFTSSEIGFSFARSFLFDLGFRYGRVDQKDIYSDGHERADVREYRVKFLEQMAHYEKGSRKYSGDTMEDSGIDEAYVIMHFRGFEIVLVAQDEACFFVNDDYSYAWGEPNKKKGFISPKNQGASFHASQFLSEMMGRVEITQEQFELENERRAAAGEDPLPQREALVTMKPGKGNKGKLLVWSMKVIGTMTW